MTTILSTLGTTGYRMLYTDELGETVLNAAKRTPRLKLSDVESRFIDEHVMPFWEQVRWLKQRYHEEDWRAVRSRFLPPEQRKQARKDFRTDAPAA